LEVPLSQREEGKLCGTDQFRHSLLEENPATFTQFKRPFLFGKLSFWKSPCFNALPPGRGGGAET
jgi:hypothetical protein